MKIYIVDIFLISISVQIVIALDRHVGKLEEVFAWKQLTYNVNENHVFQDRASSDGLETLGNSVRVTSRQGDNIVFDDNNIDEERPWNQRPNLSTSQFWQNSHNPWNLNANSNNQHNNRPLWETPPNTWTTNGLNQSITKPPSPVTANPEFESNSFFIKYNNVPMGVEKVDYRLFITVPRRRHGIPSTLNYIDLRRDSTTLSPALRPYPNLRLSRSLTSVYRTRADQCGRLWMVDTGLLEIPNTRQHVQPPAIVVFDLTMNRQILRYPFKSTDIPSSDTPAGLASITVDVNGDCSDTYAYIPDLATYGLIVYSLRENDSWRHTHNYFHFNPLMGSFNQGGLRFQWNDGIFSVTLTETQRGCKTAYFHPMISTNEFSVSTCVLRNRSMIGTNDYWTHFGMVGERGENSQSTMHAYDSKTGVIIYADVGRNAISCWNTGRMLLPANTAMLTQDNKKLNYPADVHITDDEVWIMSNSLPRFIYNRLDPNEYNFFVYKAKITDLIAGSVCEI